MRKNQFLEVVRQIAAGLEVAERIAEGGTPTENGRAELAAARYAAKLALDPKATLFRCGQFRAPDGDGKCPHCGAVASRADVMAGPEEHVLFVSAAGEAMFRAHLGARNGNPDAVYIFAASEDVWREPLVPGSPQRLLLQELSIHPRAENSVRIQREDFRS